MPDELAPSATHTHRTELIQKLDAEKELYYLTNTRCTAISEMGIKYIDKNGKEMRITAENVILAAGIQPKIQEANAFRVSANSYFTIGDCVRTATVEEAIHSAFYAAVQI